MRNLLERLRTRALVAAICLSAVASCAGGGSDPAELLDEDDTTPVPGASSLDFAEEGAIDKAACSWNVIWCRDPQLSAPECRASGCSNNKAKCKEKIRSICGRTPSAGQLWTFNGNVTFW
jgi:hypothetical protein